MRIALAIMLSLWTTIAVAAPAKYNLETSKSSVGFIYTLNGSAKKGTMPVSKANILIDLRNLRGSSVDVSVDASRAKAGLIFATEALKAKSVLNTSAYPSIRFVSERIRLNGSGQLADGAKIDGKLTVRGVTRPITLNAALYRRKDAEAGDYSRLSFKLTGSINRSDYGASGYSDLVADLIALDIVAWVLQAN